MKTISERLQYCLVKQGITAYLLSKNTGLSQSSISRILKNNSKPNRNTVTQLCKYFNINEVWLLTGNGEMEVQKEALSPSEAASLANYNNALLVKLNSLINTIKETGSIGNDNLKEANKLKKEITADLEFTPKEVEVGSLKDRVKNVEETIITMQTDFVRLFRVVMEVQERMHKLPLSKSKLVE